MARKVMRGSEQESGGGGARLDCAMVTGGFFTSRTKAQAAIKAGSVRLNHAICTKAGATVLPGDVLEVRGEVCPFVGRAGLKLQKALDIWQIELSGARCLDVGASTGGFCDCMLRAGAAQVFAVDVGHDQLDARLVRDSRVINLEGTDIRTLAPASISALIDFFAIDVSFISLTKVLPSVYSLVRSNAGGVCLIKPQFEAGVASVGKHGIVKDASTHIRVIHGVLDAVRQAGFCVHGLDFSPIKGAAGNIEYLLYIRKLCDTSGNAHTDIYASDALVTDIVERARTELDSRRP